MLELWRLDIILGAFFFANSSRSIENERLYIHLKDENDEDIVLILYAGFIARRIVPYIKSGDNLNKADRLGIIKFGSRVDIFVEKNIQVILNREIALLP